MRHGGPILRKPRSNASEPTTLSSVVLPSHWAAPLVGNIPLSTCSLASCHGTSGSTPAPLPPLPFLGGPSAVSFLDFHLDTLAQSFGTSQFPSDPPGLPTSGASPSEPALGRGYSYPSVTFQGCHCHRRLLCNSLLTQVPLLVETPSSKPLDNQRLDHAASGTHLLGTTLARGALSLT